MNGTISIAYKTTIGYYIVRFYYNPEILKEYNITGDQMFKTVGLKLNSAYVSIIKYGTTVYWKSWKYQQVITVSK